MDIAKIRKKLKQGGGSKTQKDKGKVKQPAPMSPDVSSASVADIEGKATPLPMDAVVLEGLHLPDEAQEVPVPYDDVEEIIPAMELLSFKVSGQHYAFKVDDVQEILKRQPVTPVPGTAPFLMGITSLRGTIIPVMDLSQRLLMERKHDYGKRAKILVVYGPKGSIGVLLESAVKVMSVPISSVEGPPESLSEEEMLFISGVTRDSGRLVFIIDVEELFNFSGKMEAR